jgi:microcystin-dependent protein
MVKRKIPTFNEVKNWVKRNAVPSGSIIMWSGSTTNVPNEWTLCDGNNGAPDLRNRFVAGAGDEYSVGDTGGEKEHTLTENEMPSHDHQIRTHAAPGHYQRKGHPVAGADDFEGLEGSIGDTTEDAGGDQAHENRPRFYSLAYIYKL